jgi:chemotaxis protein histidine kinase CheA
LSFYSRTGETALDGANHQRILGYFIEEAKEHLQTIEQGILELSSGTYNMDTINEMFRAAHSVKGGAAMLGYTSIQKTSHRLEDSFKILKEYQIKFDNKLESLLLAAYDVLVNLIERLETASDFKDEDAAPVMQDAEKTFVDLQQYCQKSITGGSSEVQTEEKVAAKTPDSGALDLSIIKILKQMLEFFKQKETPENRQQVSQLCMNLTKFVPEEQGWQNLVKISHKAIANPRYPYKLLAPIVLKELKVASDYLTLGKSAQITPSKDLEKLAAASMPQILIPVEPTSAAVTLINVFNKQQLSQLVQLIKEKI